jgi:hypothetical protein
VNVDKVQKIPLGYSYLATAVWFLAGGIVTAVFSGSLFVLARDVSFSEVLFVGMIVPCFTWVVQLSAVWFGLPPAKRRIYWGDLGRICLIGSVALLPAGIVNLILPDVSWWVSAANVLASVALMGMVLFCFSAKHGIAFGWPLSWCVTIGVNMGLFLWFSSDWW